MESNLLLIVRTFIHKERVELLSLVLHRLPGKGQKSGVTWSQELEIIILDKDRGDKDISSSSHVTFFASYDDSCDVFVL